MRRVFFYLEFFDAVGNAVLVVPVSDPRQLIGGFEALELGSAVFFLDDPQRVELYLHVDGLPTIFYVLTVLLGAVAEVLVLTMH